MVTNRTVYFPPTKIRLRPCEVVLIKTGVYPWIKTGLGLRGEVWEERIEDRHIPSESIYFVVQKIRRRYNDDPSNLEMSKEKTSVVLRGRVRTLPCTYSTLERIRTLSSTEGRDRKL